MNNFIKIADNIKVSALLDELEGRESLFKAQTFRQEYEGSAHKDTETIFLRWSKENTPEAIFNSYSAVDQSAINEIPSVKSLIRESLELVRAVQWGRTILVKLFPRGRILPHSDEGKYADCFERFHLVLKSDIGNSFVCGDEEVQMRPGELWWFNHKLIHSAFNNSRSTRLHLIIDAIAPLYRKERYG